MKLRLVVCFANSNTPVSHGYYAKTGRTLCGKKVKGKHWINEGPVQRDDDFGCKVCQNKWLGMEDYEFD